MRNGTILDQLFLYSNFSSDERGAKSSICINTEPMMQSTVRIPTLCVVVASEPQDLFCSTPTKLAPLHGQFESTQRRSLDHDMSD